MCTVAALENNSVVDINPRLVKSWCNDTALVDDIFMQIETSTREKLRYPTMASVLTALRLNFSAGKIQVAKEKKTECIIVINICLGGANTDNTCAHMDNIGKCLQFYNLGLGLLNVVLLSLGGLGCDGIGQITDSKDW